MGPCLVDTAADLGPFNPSSIPFGEKKEKKTEKSLRLADI